MFQQTKNNNTMKTLLLKIRKFLSGRHFCRILFIFSGLATFCWVLWRVATKPQRATYPCIQASAPVLSAFVCYLLSLFGAGAAFRSFRLRLGERKWASAMPFLLLFLFMIALTNMQDIRTSFASLTQVDAVQALSENDLNMYHDSDRDGESIGDPTGMFPGRVVWAWDNRATHNNTNEKDQAVSGRFYFMDAMNDQYVIDRLFDASILGVVGQTEGSLVIAWDSVFHQFNEKRASRFGEKARKGKGYNSGEKIFIKLNYTSDGTSFFNSGYKETTAREGNLIESSPFVTMALLRNLIEYVGVEQEDIYLGDPLRNFPRNDLEYIQERYPRVKLIGSDTKYGKTSRENGTNTCIWYADLNDPEGGGEERLNKQLEDADYLFNIPTIKGHNSAGFSAVTKNFFGAHTRENAQHLHPTLFDGQINCEYGIYRALTDLAASKHLGQKIVLNIVDFLHSCDRWDGANVKWSMKPFNSDFPSSILVSQDLVAIESVCYDFLRGEYQDQEAHKMGCPNWVGVDDYLHQLASPEHRPDAWYNTDKQYNPDKDLPLTYSLGVHEHWNPVTKSYKTIELLKLKSTSLNNTDYTWNDLDALINYPGREDEIKVLQVASYAADGDHQKYPWKDIPWMSSNFRWLINTGGADGMTKDYPGLFKAYDLNPNDCSAFYKLAWNKENKELYIMYKVKDSSFIFDTEEYDDWKNNYWTKYDILEIFFAPEEISGWHGNSQNNDDGIALHTTFGYWNNDTQEGRVRRAIDVNPQGKADDYTSYIKDSFMKKVGDYYYMEIVLDMSCVPAFNWCQDGAIKFCMTYNDVDDVNGTIYRTGQYGTIYQEEGQDWNGQDCRNSAWQIIDGMGTICFDEKYIESIVSIPTVKAVPSPVKVYGSRNEICFRNAETGARITLFDTSGRILKTALITESEQQIPLNFKGIVIVRYEYKSTAFSYKIPL